MEAAAIYFLVGLLCLLGFILSCLSLSGTWIVLVATAVAAWFNGAEFPGVATLVFFLVLCIGVEVLEAFAASWGVQKRGGSKAAGWAALGGGFLGMLLGSFIPIPIIGNLLGMVAGSCGGAFWVEHARMKRIEHAAHVATGAVLARLGVILLKISATLAMIFILAVGFIVKTKV